MSCKGILLFFAIIITLPFELFSQRAKMSREDYIEGYKDMAISEMLRSGVPASITLAQGMLESDNGNSRLAVKANNHFGIKCHNTWKGKRIYHDDDEKHECFRKYKSVEDSYRDHSDFLMNTSRYASLFELDPTDYKSWAKGLKKAGYATSRKYADLLIRIIEENELHQYDLVYDKKKNRHSKDSKRVHSTDDSGREILINNRIDYIIVKQGDSFESLRKELNLLPNELKKYNELDENASLVPGQILYLQPKRNRAEKGQDIHIMKEGESFYDVSQQYGIKLDKLLKKNHLDENDKPTPGMELNLRKNKKINLEEILIPEDTEEEEPGLEFEFAE